MRWSSLPDRPAPACDLKFDLGAYAYAHRGLWDAKRPENSLVAFEAAAAAGLGAELDVRITGDGKLAVFHDATLERMCGDAARVDELSLAEIKARALLDGSHIPTLAEALEAMAGLPVLVEIKIDAPADGEARNRTATAKVIELMRRTKAPAAVMSFDEPTVWRLTYELPGRPVGQLIEPLHRLGEDGVRALVRRALEFNCDYLAPNLTSLAAVWAAAPGIPLACWTIRSKDDLERVREHHAAPIFEGFSPALAKAR